MTDDLEARRADLEKRLASIRDDTVDAVKADTGQDRAGMARAVKMSSDFVAGVLVGALLGWGIDHFAGTSPFGMIVFLLLGFCAGVLNLLRTAGVVAPGKLGPKP
jgi:ATP synthase protein I